MAPLPLPDPPLGAGPLALRPWAPADAAALAAAWADPDVARWCAVPPARSEADAARWIDGATACRADGLALDLAVTVDGVVVGEVGLGPLQWAHRRAAVGFWTAAGHRGRGHAATAVDLLAGWALTALPLDTLVAETSAENPAAGAVLAAAGFTLAVTRHDRQAWLRP